MAKFNRTPKGAKTVNKEGSAAYSMTDKDRFRKLIPVTLESGALTILP